MKEILKKYKLLLILMIILVIVAIGAIVLRNHNSSSTEPTIDHRPEEKDVLDYPNNDIGTLENYILDEEGNKTNISLKLSEEHVFGDITGLNMTITSSNEEPRKATFTLKLLNNTDKDIDNQDIKIIFFDKNHNEQTVQYSRINHIGAHEEAEVTNDMYNRIIDAYDYSMTYFEANGVG